MKKIIISILIFIVVFVLIYSLATGGFTRFTERFFAEPVQPTQTELKNELLQSYHGISPFWLDRYEIIVNEEADLQEDADDDGLTLAQEYKYLTNPFVADTDGDGFSDGDEVFRGFSPTGEGELDNDNNGLSDKWEEDNNISGDAAKHEDSDGDGLSNTEELAYGTDPQQADTDADGYTDADEVQNGYDPVAAGDIRPSVQVEIDRIGVDAPVILSRSADEELLQKDLEGGVIRYPGMAMPGQRGNTYIAGHSSNYAWSTGSYNNIFKDLIDLQVGDVIRVTTTFQNGKSQLYTYEVEEQREVEADDPAIFADTMSQKLTLTTCWPLGTADRRIMVKAIPVS